MRKTNLLRLKPMLSLLLVVLMNVAWATTITVQLRDSDGNILPDGGTATMRWWPLNHFNQGVWITPDGNGDFVIDAIIGDEYTFRMCYNYSQEERDIVMTGANVVFNTVTFTAVVEDANGTELNMPQPMFNHRMGSWAGLTEAGTWIELMPGTHYIRMIFHTTEVDHLITIENDNHREVFRTTTITPKLLDCEGNVINTSGTKWHMTHGCIGPCTHCLLNEPEELLSGAREAFLLFYGTELVDKIGNYPPQTPPSDPNYNTPWYVPSTPADVIFTAPGIAEAFVWNDLDENGVQDVGEPGISGVQVDIVEPNGTWLMTAYTNGQGIASFIDYPWDVPIKMHVYAPMGMEPTKSSGPKTNPDNSDIDKNGLTPAFSGGSCATFIDWIGAGLVYTSTNKMANSIPKFGIYPNPTKSFTSVSYAIETDSKVSVIVYDLLGREVAVIDEGNKTAGQYEVTWYADKLEPGTYICRFNLGEKAETMRLVITE